MRTDYVTFLGLFATFGFHRLLPVQWQKSLLGKWKRVSQTELKLINGQLEN